MLSSLTKRLSCAFILILFICLSPVQAETIYYYDGKTGQANIADVMKQNPLGPEENIKSTLLHKSAGASLHLVQIRFREEPHIHRSHDLIVSLKKGRGILHIENQGIPMVEGDTAVIPRGAVHYFENTGDDIAAGIGIFTPPFNGTDTTPADKGMLQN